MAIGTFGGLIFQTSEGAQFTPKSFSREIASRTASHEAIGGKPRTEFLGAGLQTVSMEFLLRADHGISPRARLEQLARMVENGEAHRLIIGGRPVGQNPFRVASMSETWNTVYRGGELFSASVTVELEEYV